MKYFLDTEFHEYKKQHKVLGIKAGNPTDTIELISIGIVAEDDRGYYAICKEFDVKAAWGNEWLKENVLKPIFYELIGKDINFHSYDNYFNYEVFKTLINKHGKTKAQIAEEIKEFVGYPSYYPQNEFMRTKVDSTKPEFYGYYADYDWVVFCWIFGRMIDLPDGFPKFAFDLKQILDSKYMSQENKYENMTRLEAWVQDIKNNPNYPKQEDEHNALADAKWNKQLYEFLKSL